MSSLVQNAADPSQVKNAERRTLHVQDQEKKDLQEVMALKSGRRFIHRLLSRCGTYQSIWRPSAEIHYLAGQQDIGHFILKQLDEAAPENYLVMLNEHQKERK